MADNAELSHEGRKYMSEKVHRIVERAVMPDGTKIQIEDWSEVYPGTYDIPLIAAYPKSKRDATWWKKGESFRLELSQDFTSTEEVQEVFKQLLCGSVTLEKLEKHYIDDKARYYMDIVDTWDRPMRKETIW